MSVIPLLFIFFDIFSGIPQCKAQQMDYTYILLYHNIWLFF